MNNTELILEFNKNDAKIDTRQLPTNKKIFKKTVAGALVSFVLFSGSAFGLKSAYADNTIRYEQLTQTTYENQVIFIPETYQYTVASLCEKNVGEPITIKDLQKVNEVYISVSITDNSSLEWIQYLGNVDNLLLAVHEFNPEVFNQLNGLPGIKELKLTTFNEGLTITSDVFNFLKNSPNLEKLDIFGFNVEPGFLEILTNLKILSIETDGTLDIDFKKLTFLDELQFGTLGPYDVAVDFTIDEYNVLKNAGVNINFYNNNLEVYLKINEKLDAIIATLGVDKNSSDQEKLEAILIYVCENLQYDEQVSMLINSGQNASSIIETFYKGGILYGALEKDTAICGNYAALTSALAERLEMNNYYLTSANHSWNLVEVEGQFYYVDSTWLDGIGLRIKETSSGINEEGYKYTSTSYSIIPAHEAIKMGKSNELDWYMEDPTNYPNSNQVESHVVNNLPSYITLKPIVSNIPDEESINVSKEIIKITNETKFKINIGSKTYIIGGAALIGIFAGLGAAIAVKNHRRKKEKLARDLEDPWRYYENMQGYGWNQSQDIKTR